MGTLTLRGEESGHWAEGKGAGSLLWCLKRSGDRWVLPLPRQRGPAVRGPGWVQRALVLLSWASLGLVLTPEGPHSQASVAQGTP